MNAWKCARFMDLDSNPWPIHSKCRVKSTPSGRIPVTGTWCTPPNGASTVLNHMKALLDQDTRLRTAGRCGVMAELPRRTHARPRCRIILRT
jgi:hypothetical protein